MNIKALISEFLGAFALIFIGIGSVAMATRGDGNLTSVALAHGLTVAVMASAVGAISGGHFNPAVSFAAWIGKKLTTLNMLAYWIFQLLGGLVGAYAIRFCSQPEDISNINFGMPQPTGVITMGQAGMMEALGTFFLVFVVYGTAIDRRAPKMGALFIGLTLSAVIMCFGPLTGASVNPARYLGPALLMKDYGGMAVYLGAPMLGAALAALIYNYLLADRDPEMPVSDLAP